MEKDQCDCMGCTARRNAEKADAAEVLRALDAGILRTREIVTEGWDANFAMTMAATKAPTFSGKGAPPSVLKATATVVCATGAAEAAYVAGFKEATAVFREMQRRNRMAEEVLDTPLAERS